MNGGPCEIPRIILLSGHICSGKTTLAEGLFSAYNIAHVKTGGFLSAEGAKVGIPSDRDALQKLGEQLDRKTKGKWVLEHLQNVLKKLPADTSATIDAVRVKEQILAIREAFGQTVLHIHLLSNEKELERRFAVRKKKNGSKNLVKELKTLREALANKTESKVDELQAEADVVIWSDRCSREDIQVRVACHLGLHGRQYDRCVDVIVGGQYGSEGKGQVAAYLAREYQMLVRVGGPNAGHKVFLRPEPFTYHHLPSGTMSSPQAKIVIGPGASLYVETLLKEIAFCQLQSRRLSIDPYAIIITEQDRQREMESLRGRISSTAQGVGEATVRRIKRLEKNRFAKDVPELRPYIRPALVLFETAFNRGEKVFLEGTQGTALSLYHGNYPYVTSRDTTVAGCLAEAGISPSRVNKVVMVCRTYPIRVQNPENGGTSGPMSKELSIAELGRRSGLNVSQLRVTETTSTTKRRRRIAEFDWSLLRRSSSLNAPTDIALTFADYLDARNESARRFDQLQTDTIRFVEEVERVACAPVSLISTRFHDRAIIDRRAW